MTPFKTATLTLVATAATLMIGTDLFAHRGTWATHQPQRSYVTFGYGDSYYVPQRRAYYYNNGYYPNRSYYYRSYSYPSSNFNNQYYDYNNGYDYQNNPGGVTWYYRR